MNKIRGDIQKKIDELSDLEKQLATDYLLADFDKPNPEIDKLWAKEALRRQKSMRSGKMETHSYDDVSPSMRGVSKMNIKPIKTYTDYKAALNRIEALWDAEINTNKGDELSILTILVENYENEKFKILPPDPIEAIKFRME